MSPEGLSMLASADRKKIPSVWIWLAVAAAMGGICWVVDSIDRTVRDAYAAEWVAGMTIRYMDAHHGAWPRGWDDLRETYEASVEEVGHPWKFEELRERVAVDWDAVPAALADAEPPRRVVSLKSGSTAHWAGNEANEMIRDYLRGRNQE
jgi:hypothetical protein